MDLGLQGRIAVVTGAGKGIGLAVTQALAAEGVHVVAGSRKSTAELAQLHGTGKAQAIEVDLATTAGPAHLIAAALAHGRIDILINNVGAVSPRLTGWPGRRRAARRSHLRAAAVRRPTRVAGSWTFGGPAARLRQSILVLSHIDNLMLSMWMLQR